MLPHARDAAGGTINMHALLAYVADLELEVDHLPVLGEKRQQISDPKRSAEGQEQ